MEELGQKFGQLATFWSSFSESWPDLFAKNLELGVLAKLFPKLGQVKSNLSKTSAKLATLLEPWPDFYAKSWPKTWANWSNISEDKPPAQKLGKLPAMPLNKDLKSCCELPSRAGARLRSPHTEV